MHKNMCDSSSGYSFTVDGGPTGINLHSVKNGKGTFVESFYRTDEGVLLAAEKCEEVQIGDRLAFIDDICVKNYRIEETRDVLLSRVGAYKVTVARIQTNLSLVELTADPRVSSWLGKYLQFYCLKAEAEKVDSKIRLANFLRVVVHSKALIAPSHTGHSDATEDLKSICCSCVLYCVEQYPVCDVPKSVVEIVRSLVEEAEVPFPVLLDGVECVLDLVWKDLERTLLLKFQACTLKKQMLGWISASPKFVPVQMNDILEQQDMLVLYFLYLCTIRRQRHVRVLLNIRHRTARETSAADSGGKLNELYKRIVLEAARDELLMGFYGSPIFEAVLIALRGRSVSAEPEAELRPPTGNDLLQRTLRSITLPEGISLHRRARPRVGSSTSEDTDQAEKAVRLLSFHASSRTASEQPQQDAEEIVVETDHCATLQLPVPQHDLLEHFSFNDEKLSAGLVQFLLPEDRMVEGTPQLFSFVITQKNGSYMYGASLVTFVAEDVSAKEIVKACPVLSAVEVEREQDAAPGEIYCGGAGEKSSEELPIDLSPLDSTSADSCAACEDHVYGTKIGAVLSRSHSSQQALSRVTDGAGQLLRGIRQWSELALPPHMPSVSSVSSLRSLSVSATAATPSSVHESITPLTPSFWELGATLSSAWTRPSAQVKAPLQILEEIEASDEMCGLWDAEAGSRSADEVQLRPGQFTGVALLCELPAINALRKSLCALVPVLGAEGAQEAAAWQQTVSMVSGSEHIVPLLQGVPLAEDFNPEVVFEILSAQNLATLFMAMLLEYKIVMVSTCKRTAALLIGEWLRLAISPLDWCHIYAPVAPPHLALELLQCPAPYILGIARHTLRAARAVPPSDAVVVDLDAHSVRAPADLKAMLPATRDLVANLLPILQPHFAACDSFDPARTDLRGSLAHPDGPVGLCRSFLSQTLASVSKCTTLLTEGPELMVALDEKKFLQKASQLLQRPHDGEEEKHATQLFLKQLMRSQSFSEHLLLSVC